MIAEYCISGGTRNVKRTIFCIAFLSLLAVCLTSCGSTYNLRTIQLTGSASNLQGIGATIQLQAEGTYSYGPNKDLTNLVTYTIIVDPDSNLALDTNGTFVTLPTPPQTAMVSVTGLVTAVDPAVCAWEDLGTATTPAWATTGEYEVTATYRGVTSQPFFIAVASAAGPPAAPANGQCGPTAAQ
jgi:hypothetical protein